MPLTFDMPFDQLQVYQGVNPRPDDFDRFWNASLAELKAVPPAVKMIPANFPVPYAECFDLFFNGTGGAKVHAKLLRPRNAQKPNPAVLMFHGYSCNAGDWVDKLPYVAMGFTVAALDCRGQAGLSQDPGGQPGMTLHGHIIRGIEGRPEDLMFRNVFLDTARLASIVMDMPYVDPGRVGVTGASQGGGLTLACAALVPEIKKAAPLYPFLCDYQRVWQIDQDENAYAEIREYFRWRDPLHLREQEFFTRLGYIDVQNLCPRIRGEVYMAVGLRDTICPPSTQFAAYNKISAPKSLAIYPDFTHEELRGHPDRVFQFLSDL